MAHDAVTCLRFPQRSPLSLTKGGRSMNSWIIVNAETGEAVMETWDSTLIPKLRIQYQAVPARKYLEELNGKIKRENQE